MFTARPAAKLNLTLEVAQRGADGYHPISSIFLRIGLSDRLTARQAGRAEGDRLTIGGPLAAGLDQAPVTDNLVLRAAVLVRQRVGLPLPALEVELEKHIPIAGGLGGGSSDGAAMLELAAACWGIGLSPAEKLGLAALLGSDVPFFATGAAAALVEGRGERVTPLPAPRGEPGLLLLTPSLEVSTAAAYARFDDAEPPRAAADHGVLSAELADDLRAGLDGPGLLRWTARLRDANDLWPPVVGLAPELATLRDLLEQHSRRPWLLSGSGSSLFTFYASPSEAAEAGARLCAEPTLHSSRVLVQATGLDGPDAVWRQS